MASGSQNRLSLVILSFCSFNVEYLRNIVHFPRDGDESMDLYNTAEEGVAEDITMNPTALAPIKEVFYSP